MCNRLVFLKKPAGTYTEWLWKEHIVLRVIRPPAGETREMSGALLAISILVSMMVMFLLWSTSPICQLQDECRSSCMDSPGCKGMPSSYANMSSHRWPKPSPPPKEWDPCFQSAIDWRQKPGNMFSELVCYFPNATDLNTLQCIDPLQGNACADEKKYMQMLTGASSIGVIISFLFVPRLLQSLYSLLFTTCCTKLFVKTKGKAVKGVSMGILLLVGLGLLVAILVVRGGSGFIGLRLLVWAVSWIGTMFIVEPLLLLISYRVVRCKRSDEEEREDRPLLITEAAPPATAASSTANEIDSPVSLDPEQPQDDTEAV